MRGDRRAPEPSDGLLIADARRFAMRRSSSRAAASFPCWSKSSATAASSRWSRRFDGIPHALGAGLPTPPKPPTEGLLRFLEIFARPGGAVRRPHHNNARDWRGPPRASSARMAMIQSASCVVRVGSEIVVPATRIVFSRGKSFSFATTALVALVDSSERYSRPLHCFR
jgi:hypothetical protein